MFKSPKLHATAAADGESSFCVLNGNSHKFSPDARSPQTTQISTPKLPVARPPAPAEVAAKDGGERPPTAPPGDLLWLVSAEATREVEEAEKSVGEEGPDVEGAARLRAPFESILMGEEEDLRGGEVLESKLLGPLPLTMEGVMETMGAAEEGGGSEEGGELPPSSFSGERCLLSSAAAAAFVSCSSLSLFCHSRA